MIGYDLIHVNGRNMHSWGEPDDKPSPKKGVLKKVVVGGWLRAYGLHLHDYHTYIAYILYIHHKYRYNYPA